MLSFIIQNSFWTLRWHVEQNTALASIVAGLLQVRGRPFCLSLRAPHPWKVSFPAKGALSATEAAPRGWSWARGGGTTPGRLRAHSPELSTQEWSCNLLKSWGGGRIANQNQKEQDFYYCGGALGMCQSHWDVNLVLESGVRGSLISKANHTQINYL